jgi:hypothetical protein
MGQVFLQYILCEQEIMLYYGKSLVSRNCLSHITNQVYNSAEWRRNISSVLRTFRKWLLGEVTNKFYYEGTELYRQQIREQIDQREPEENIP